MNETTEDDVLASLDWDVKVKCAFRSCRYEATSMVLTDPTTHDHEWREVCAGHEASMRRGEHRCTGCNETVIVNTVRKI